MGRIQRSEQLSGALDDAALTEGERQVLERLLAGLQKKLGDDLLAVWLYGSRARGEANIEETDPDLKSDIDLMVIVDPSRDAHAVRRDVAPLIEEAAAAEGESPVWYSIRVYDADRLRNRREIRSFFFQEVDRDKLVLVGSRLEGAK